MMNYSKKIIAVQIIAYQDDLTPDEAMEYFVIHYDTEHTHHPFNNMKMCNKCRVSDAAQLADIIGEAIAQLNVKKGLGDV